MVLLFPRIMTARNILFSVFASALLSLTAMAQDEWRPSQFWLANGMEVVVLPDHRVPVVTHMVWYRVGSAHEEQGKSGIAHLFEHVMFKETDDIGPGEFSSIINDIGGRANAFTSYDYTAYYERVAKQHLGLVMSLEAERMTDLIINDDPQGPFISERDVVKEERRQRIENNPSVILWEKAMEVFYEDHPYEITIIGKMDEVSRLTPQDGLDFYRKYYSPENAVLLVAGDVTEDEVRELANYYYGTIERSETFENEHPWKPVKRIAESSLIVHKDPKVRQPQWTRYYNGISWIEDKEFVVALQVGLNLLGGGLTSHLYQTIVEQQQLAISVGSDSWSERDEGPAYLTATPVQGVDLETLEKAVMKEVEFVLEYGFEEKAVITARNNLAANAIYLRENQQSMASTFGRARAIGIPIDDILNYAELVKSVTPDEALDALRKIFGGDAKYIETHLLPEGDW